MSIGELLSQMASSDKRLLIAAFVFAALYVVFEACALRCILKRAGYIRKPLNCLLYSTSDVYFSAITPSATGGQPASAFFMVKDGIPGGKVTATLLLNLIMYTVSAVVLGLASIIIRPGSLDDFGTSSRILIVFGFVCLIFLTLLFLVLLKNVSFIFDPLVRLTGFLHKKKIFKNEEKILARLDKIKNDYESCAGIISGSKRVLLYAFIWNFLQRAAQIAVPALIYASLTEGFSGMTDIFLKQCLVTIGYNCIPIPGGMGVSDYLMIDAFKSVMGSEMAYVVEFISRGITFYICVSVSGLITLAGYLAKYGGKVRK